MNKKYFLIFQNSKRRNFLVVFFFFLLKSYAQNDTNDVIALQNKSFVFQQSLQLDSILYYENEALKISKEINYIPGIAHSLSNFGLVYKMKGDYPKALENLFKALGIFEKLGNKNGIIVNLGNIGTVYDMQGDYSKALEIYFKALKISQTINNQRYISMQYRNIANIYAVQSKLKKAEEYFLYALGIDRSLNDKQGVAIDLMNLGSLYTDNNSLNYYLQALAIFKELDKKEELTNCIINISSLYIELNNKKKAEEYLKQAIPMVETMEDKGTKVQLQKIISQIYTELGNDKLALEYYSKYIELRDSIFNEENTKRSVKAEMNYEFEKKQAAIKFEHDKIIYKLEAESKMQKQLRLFLVLFIVLVLVLLFFAKRAFDTKKKYAEVLSLENSHKEILLQEVHHRVNNSLQMISSLLSIQADNTTNEEVREYLTKSENRIHAMSAMHELLFESNNNKTDVDIDKYIFKVFDFYKKLLETIPQIKLETNIPNVGFHSKVALPIALIINELITNALKYAFPDERPGTISVSLIEIDKNSNKWKLTVSDNGIGLSENSSSKRANSLGLRLVNIMTKQLKGTLNIINKTGVSFEIIFNSDFPV